MMYCLELLTNALEISTNARAFLAQKWDQAKKALADAMNTFIGNWKENPATVLWSQNSTKSWMPWAGYINVLPYNFELPISFDLWYWTKGILEELSNKDNDKLSPNFA